ncbi:MAG: DUF3857 domain-containing protein [Bacteroidales bacterium]|nr:DUF3857 domain-containing protein [Bacteroidales bacterium]
MNKRFKRILTFSILMLFATAAVAQTIKFNPKLDAVSDDEVKMTTYAPDTSANALYIYKGMFRSVYLTPSGDFAVEKTYRYRIKILKESAKDLATFQMVYRTDGDLSEKITDIKVTTFNWENGKVVKTKMSKEFIFDKKYSDNMKTLSFTAQNVKVGSVIEVSYVRKNQHFWNIGELNFQGEYPINCMEAKITYPDMLKFNLMSRGIKYYSLVSTGETKAVVLRGGGSFDYENSVEVYKAVNVPALKAEGNIYCIDQFYSAVEYELRTIKYPNSIPKNYGASWKDVDNQFYETKVCTEITSSCKLKSEVDPIKNSTDLSFEEKVVKIRELVASKVKWNKKINMLPAPISYTLKEASGSNADINALVGNCLNYAGFTVHPVLIKLRTSGELAEFHVSYDAFDTFILKVIDKEGKSLYLDASDDNGYINVLPDNFLVSQAREIAKGFPSAWVDLTNPSKNTLMIDVNGKLDEDGLLTATMAMSAYNSESRMIKTMFNALDKDDELFEQLEGGNSYTVNSVKKEQNKDYTSTCKAIVDLEQQMQTASGSEGEIIYLKPIIEHFHRDSYFKSETRSVPVDIDRRNTVIYHLKLELPEGWSVEQMPKSEKLGMLKLNMNATVVYKVVENVLEVTYKTVTNEMFVEPGDYPDYRRFWQQLVKIENETVVLKKK